MHRCVKVALAAASICAVLVPNIPAGATTFNAPVVVTANNETEPGMEVSPNGTLIIHAPTGLPLMSNIYRSTNGGANWGQMVPIFHAGLGGGDIDIAIQPNGKMAMTDLWLGSSTTGFSTDNGANWITNDDQGVLGQDRQWLATVGEDIVYHVTHQLGAGLVVSKSVDGGLVYPLHSLAASTLDQGNCICPPGTLVASRGTQPAGIDDKVGVIYSTSTGVKFARSVNGATTWTQTVIDPTGGGSTLEAFPIVARGDGDYLAAVWLEVNASSSRVFFASSTNFGQTWTSPKVIVSSGTSVYPWVDVKGSKVAVSLYHTSASGRPDSVPEAGSWFIKYLASGDGGATWPTSLDVADPTEVKTGPICTDGINCGEDRELGDFQMVALDANAKANIAYVRSWANGSDTEIRYVRES